MVKSIILVFFLLATFNCLYSQDNQDEITIERIKWLYQLKDALGNNWPEYNSDKYEVPMAYFTDSTTYIVNPGDFLKNKLNLNLKYEDPTISIFQNDTRIDTIEFHMHTAYDNEETTLIYYKNPVTMCSDYETTQKFVDDVNSLQKWASMVLHEFFHGFQFKHDTFLKYAHDSISLSGTKLQSYYDSNKWYKELVDEENLLLLSCLSSDDKIHIKQSLKKLFKIREKRRAIFQDSLHFDISHQEAFYEKMEGSARYIEWQILKDFKNIPDNKILIQIDTAYQENAYHNVQLENEPWMYETNSVLYFYSSGFNFLRLLDKLEIKYKSYLFNNNPISFYDLLKNYIED